MSGTIDTDEYSTRLRSRAVNVVDLRLLIARIGSSEQAQDLTKPANCEGFGRVRHFERVQSDWLPNPLPIDPACRALGIDRQDVFEAQVFQNAACNWRCWYCFVPFRLLDASEESSAWMSAGELLDLYLREPQTSRARMLDLTGGQPDLVPEWVPWTMEAIRARGLEGQVYLWSDDNLSNDYFWRYLSTAQRELVASFSGYGRVACFKGFNDASFAFNTKADPALFSRQFELFRRLLSTGMDLYAYVTFTAPDYSVVEDAMERFVDRLQEIHENLPLRTVPLKVGAWGVVKRRLVSLGAAKHSEYERAISNQRRALDAWARVVEARFPQDLRMASIVDVPMRSG